MAFDPIGYLQGGLNRLTPPGGYGIPNLGALQEMLRRDSSSGLRGAIGRDYESLGRMGLGRNVAGAFNPGTRGVQFNQSLMDALQQLAGQNAQLGFSQRNQTLQSLLPALQMAYEQSQRPSFLSQLAGGVLGLGAQVAIPGLGGMLFPDPIMKYLLGQSMQSRNVPTSFMSP